MWQQEITLTKLIKTHIKSDVYTGISCLKTKRKKLDEKKQNKTKYEF